jgi:predicted hydrolase (HD superfamily)
METLGLSYDQAAALVDKHITEPITKLHLRETEAIMRSLARRFEEDEEQWGIVGLLHDIDWDLAKDNVSEHCLLAQSILKEAGASDFLIEAVISHGFGNQQIPGLMDRERVGRLQYCLVAAETLTGLIIAAGLVQPDKKLASVTLGSLQSKFKNYKFAAKCDRNLIRECEKAEINIDNFLALGLDALQGIAPELGM